LPTEGGAGSDGGTHGGTWPTYAHDFQRTSRADGAGQMTAPQVAWTRRMGGVLAAGQAIVADVDLDGRPNVVTIVGGRVTATNPDGTTLWQGALAGTLTVLGVWNLDGVGGNEVVVDTSTGVEILAGVDGHLLTSLAASLPASASFAPIGPQGGILIVGMSGAQLMGFDFRQGTQVTAPVWTQEDEDPSDATVADIDGDSQLDLVHSLNAGFQVLDPATGAVEYQEGPIGPLAFFYSYQLVNVDGAPGLEILAVDSSYVNSPPTGIYLLGVRNGALTTLWSSTATPSESLGAQYYAVDGAVQDLDSDGVKEAVYSTWDGTTWATQIVDAAQGTAIATIPGKLVQALADVDGDGRVEIVVRSNPLADMTPAATGLSVYDFTSRASPPTARSWVVANAHMLTSATGGPLAPVVANFDATPGVEMLVGLDPQQTGADTSIIVLRGDGTTVSTLPVAAGLTPSVLWEGNALTSATSQADVLTATGDGVAHVLTSSLSQSASFTTGSYTNWMGVYSLDASRSMLAMSTSTHDLLWLDGTHMHIDGTPYQIADLPGAMDTSAWAATYWPLDPLTYLAGKSPTLVAFVQGATGVTMVGLDTAGVETWRTPLAPGTQILPPGLYAQDLTGDGIPDPIVSQFNINSLESLAVFDGTTGVVVRSTPLASIATGDQTTTGALVDVNGDGVPDLVAPLHPAGEVAFDLTTNPMSLLWTVSLDAVTPPTYAGTIAALRVDANGSGLLRFNGNLGSGAYMHISLAGKVVASSDQGLINLDGGDRNGVALVQRTPGANVYDLVSAGMEGAALARVRRIAGDTLATVWTEYAAGGTVSLSPPAHPFALRDPIAVDVDGDGKDEVVLGGDDGWLYALHASDGSVAFALDLGAPVSHIIAADIDLDPALELVVSLLDGRLVAIDQPDHYQAVRDSSSGDAAVEAGGSEGGATATAPMCMADGGLPYIPVHESCACRAVASSDHEDGAIAMAIVLAGLTGARRRSRVLSAAARPRARLRTSPPPPR
jgi:hypothetical protein